VGSYMSWPLYPQSNTPKYSLYTRLGEFQSWYRRCGEKSLSAVWNVTPISWSSPVFLNRWYAYPCEHTEMAEFVFLSFLEQSLSTMGSLLPVDDYHLLGDDAVWLL
jgi:hypothetical protein